MLLHKSLWYLFYIELQLLELNPENENYTAHFLHSWLTRTSFLATCIDLWQKSLTPVINIGWTNLQSRIKMSLFKPEEYKINMK